jgi:tRNA dimethylallyltransferase
MTVVAGMAVEPQMIVILGPTASGKSALALALAAQIGAEILSVDSMQVYRAMDVGTAKPSYSEQERIRHHLIDIVEPCESFTVARFVELADEAIANASGRNIPLIATGGTPLYYKALFQGLFTGPSRDDAVRDRLRDVPGEELHRRLEKIDPAAAARIHLNDTRRLIRALEVHELTGQSISSLQTEWASPATRHPALWVGLLWDRESLNRRINARVKAMIADGWLNETQFLLGRFGSLSPTAGEATGYRELIDHLQGKCSLEDAVEQIKIATRQLARRQMKWFKRFPNVHWLPGDRPVEENLAEILRIRTVKDGKNPI